MTEEIDKMMTKLSVRRFDGKDIKLWKIRFENSLKTNQCWNAVKFLYFDLEVEVNTEKDEKSL